MATIAIGDIHGNAEALADLLGQLRGELDPGDTGLDTSAHGVLTAMRLPDGRVFQSPRFR
jgi:hypothetical protein